MESELAKYAEQQLIEAAKRMTPEQRLQTYLAHSKRMVELQRAGKRMRAAEAAHDKALTEDTQKKDDNNDGC